MPESASKENYSFYEHTEGKFITFMHNTDSVSYISRRHYHHAVEIGFVIHGQAGYITNDKIETIGPGEMSYIDSWDVHYFDIHSGNETFTLVIGPGYLRDFYNFYGDANMIPYFAQALRNQECNQAVLKILCQWEDCYNPEDILQNQGFVNLILAELAKGYPVLLRKRNRDDVGLVNEILNYVNNNYTKDITLDDVAEELGYGKHYCSKLFHEYIDMDFRHYVNGVRIEAAKRMLLDNPKRSISDIAFRCGFSSMKTFYRAYRRVYDDVPKRK